MKTIPEDAFPLHFGIETAEPKKRFRTQDAFFFMRAFFLLMRGQGTAIADVG